MTYVQKQYVYGEKNKKTLNVRILTKGQDGATWYSGDPKTAISCKKGDFCFNPETFDVFKCINGGNKDTSQWELVCNLNNLNLITGFVNKYKTEIENILRSLDMQAEELKQDILNTLKFITDSEAYKPWWFGTRAEYNSMTEAERNEYELHFIEEGS